MCGVIGGAGEPNARALAALKHRGPDAQAVVSVGPWWLGHARLSVQDPSPRSHQPMLRGHTTISYNGELWNAPALRAELRALGRTFETSGDTEVLCHALDEWGTDALEKLEGMFAVAWTDGTQLGLARDRFGEVPLHVGRDERNRLVFSSELKALREAGVTRSCPQGMVAPGTCWTFLDAADRGHRSTWYDAPLAPAHVELEEAALQLRGLLEEAVDERCVADVPVCTLLSGGIDSAIVCMLLAKRYPGIVAYLAVMDERSKDVRCAREVAEMTGATLVEVKVEPPTAEDLAGVVRAIEMQSKAQVEIGWPCAALAERMRVDGHKVTFSGEGSDELWASYGFAYHGLKKAGWHRYRKDLFLDQHHKNFARANKIFMACGVECRLPFLNTKLVERALSLPEKAVQLKGRPKAVLQEAFRGLLPASVIDRQKLAFQDGLGMKDAAARAVADPRRFYASEFGRI